jgi:hypothetical protein
LAALDKPSADDHKLLAEANRTVQKLETAALKSVELIELHAGLVPVVGILGQHPLENRVRLLWQPTRSVAPRIPRRRAWVALLPRCSVELAVGAGIVAPVAAAPL